MPTIYLEGNPKYNHVSSTLIRSICKGGNQKAVEDVLTELVPNQVASQVAELYGAEEWKEMGPPFACYRICRSLSVNCLLFGVYVGAFFLQVSFRLNAKLKITKRSQIRQLSRYRLVDTSTRNLATDRRHPTSDADRHNRWWSASLSCGDSCAEPE